MAEEEEAKEGEEVEVEEEVEKEEGPKITDVTTGNLGIKFLTAVASGMSPVEARKKLGISDAYSSKLITKAKEMGLKLAGAPERTEEPFLVSSLPELPPAPPPPLGEEAKPKPEIKATALIPKSAETTEWGKEDFEKVKAVIGDKKFQTMLDLMVDNKKKDQEITRLRAVLDTREGPQGIGGDGNDLGVEDIVKDELLWQKYEDRIRKQLEIRKRIREMEEEMGLRHPVNPASNKVVEALEKLSEKIDKIGQKSELEKLKDEFKAEMATIRQQLSGGSKDKGLESVSERLERLEKGSEFDKLNQAILDLRKEVTEAKSSGVTDLDRVLKLTDQVQSGMKEMQQLRGETDTKIAEMQRDVLTGELTRIRDEVARYRDEARSSGGDPFQSFERIDAFIKSRVQEATGGPKSEVASAIQQGATILKPLIDAAAVGVQKRMASSEGGATPIPRVQVMACEKCGAQIPIPDQTAEVIVCPNCNTRYERPKE